MTIAQRFVTQHAAPFAVLPAVPEPSGADEANHRVANSLQLLAAMVSIEARRIADPIALAALETTMRRISAIAGVHRRLYQSRSATQVDLAAYLEDLGADLEASCADAGIGRRVIVSAEAIQVPPEAATSIGVIVSELVGNACKYAYPADEPGDIRVILRKMPLGGYRLEVSDRGRGIVPGAKPEGSGLGTQLIAMMVKRLDGRYLWKNAYPGTRFSLCVAR